MSTLVLAIETVGRDWVEFSESSRKGLLKSFENKEISPAEKERQLIERLALSPFTGQIISLAMYDIERDLGAVYFVADTEEKSFTDGSFTYKVRSELEILEDFWEGASNYDLFVTFNGRSFSLPFIYQRSAAHKIIPRLEIPRQKTVLQQSFPYHVDLLNEFTESGSVQPRPSLAILADLYGIEYSPVCEGVEVAEFFRQKKFRQIAERNATNVLTITKLYKIWLQYLAPRAFINTLES